MKEPSQPITGKLAMLISADLKRDDMRQHQIAAKYDVNPGRITETKQDKHGGKISLYIIGLAVTL